MWVSLILICVKRRISQATTYCRHLTVLLMSALRSRYYLARLVAAWFMQLNGKAWSKDTGLISKASAFARIRRPINDYFLLKQSMSGLSKRVS